LEVSSPGLGRPLKKEKDYVRSIGKEVDIHLYKSIEKQKEFTGVLKSYTKEEIVLQIEDTDVTFDRTNVALIRLSFDF
jgi:ribosome maturation factor RimP